ncbi:MAG: hypothetical protein J0M18_01820 [Ignavibacteria bacterium]|nr:hypothetical protein [Ignavibacteria bacterium]
MHTLIFLDTLFSQFSIAIYKAIPSVNTIYVIIILSLIIVNFFTRKLKLTFIIIVNLIILFVMYIFLISPHTKGERLNNDMNCAKEYINRINEHLKLNGFVPENLDDLEKTQCIQNVKIKYTKIFMEKYNEMVNERRSDLKPLKKDSYIVLLYFPEFSPEYLKYTEFKNEFMIEDD